MLVYRLGCPSVRGSIATSAHSAELFVVPIPWNDCLRTRISEPHMFLRGRLTKPLDGRTFYDQFEMIVSAIVIFLISTVIVYSIILTVIKLTEDFLSGIAFMDAGLFKDTFGMILTILILLEFNHSIISALRQRAGAMQVSIIVLISITVIARKLILLDYASASLETLLGLGGLALALGALYWLITSVERRRRVPVPRNQVPS
jgi:uncharacterized membrane protein (DUF373 family)